MARSTGSSIPEYDQFIACVDSVWFLVAYSLKYIEFFKIHRGDDVGAVITWGGSFLRLVQVLGCLDLCFGNSVLFW